MFKMQDHDLCHKCGNLVSNESLTSVLYSDPDYKVCELCFNENQEV